MCEEGRRSLCNNKISKIKFVRLHLTAQLMFSLFEIRPVCRLRAEVLLLRSSLSFAQKHSVQHSRTSTAWNLT